MNAIEMQAHVIELCEANDIAYRFRDTTRGAWAHRDKQRRITSPTIKSPITYLTALHELGHHLGPEQRDRRIVQEIAAWEWALSTARTRHTKGVKKSIARGLKSYITRYTMGLGYGAKQAWLPSTTDRPDVHRRLTRLLEGRYR